MRITKTNKTLSQREMSRLIKNKNTINLSSIERRKNTRYEKKIKALKFKGLILLIILTILLGLFQYKVYGDIEPIQTTKIEVKQEIDPLDKIFTKEYLVKRGDNKGPLDVLEEDILTTKEYLEAQTKAYTKEYRQQMQGLKIFMTSYNAEEGQTDDTPCIAGGTRVNICEAEKEGRRIIALSQELTGWSQIGKVRKKLNCGRGCITFEAKEKVNLEQTMESIKKQGYNSRCNGEFEVSDAMNVRYRKRGDLFFSDRKQNTSCDVKIYKLK